MWMRPESASRKPCVGSSAEKAGRAPRARLTFATVPFARKFFMRLAKVGSSCEGSTRWKKVRLGSIPETTASTAISSPPVSTTPVTAPSLRQMCRTSASVRISAPACFANSARARVKLPSPPRGKAAVPTGCVSQAARIRRTAVEPADQGPSAVPKMPHAEIAAGLKEIPEIFCSGLVDRWRRDRNELVEDSREMIESVREFNVFDGILGGNTRNTASGLGVIVPEEKRVAIGCGGKYARAGIEYFAIEFFNLHVARDLYAKRAEGMGECGSFEAGIKFLGDGAATDHFAAFEDEWLETTLGEIEGGDESVVAAADENYALSERHGQSPASERGELDFVARAREAGDHSFKMTWLAMRPLAPMMPPPGCVADPHI